MSDADLSWEEAARRVCAQRFPGWITLNQAFMATWELRRYAEIAQREISTWLRENKLSALAMQLKRTDFALISDLVDKFPTDEPLPDLPCVLGIASDDDPFEDAAWSVVGTDVRLHKEFWYSEEWATHELFWYGGERIHWDLSVVRRNPPPRDLYDGSGLNRDFAHRAEGVCVERGAVDRLLGKVDSKGTTESATEDEIRQFLTKQVADSWANNYAVIPPPTEAASLKLAKATIGKRIERDLFRKCRREIVPPEWLTRGPRAPRK